MTQHDDTIVSWLIVFVSESPAQQRISSRDLKETRRYQPRREAFRLAVAD